MKGLGLVLVWCLTWGLASSPIDNRPQKLAVVKAHQVLPKSLRWVVKRHGSHLFSGLDAGLRVPAHKVSIHYVKMHQGRIAAMINQRAPFSDVVFQMGYVAGIVALILDPSRETAPQVQRGFEYYMNYKLGRFLFVFEGYEALSGQYTSVETYLEGMARSNSDYRQLLTRYYAQVGWNERYPFDERSPVFGVCSIYFSKLAGTCAYLWRDAWAKANGDLSGTPFVAPQRMPLRRQPNSIQAQPGQTYGQPERPSQDPRLTRPESN